MKNGYLLLGVLGLMTMTAMADDPQLNSSANTSQANNNQVIAVPPASPPDQETPIKIIDEGGSLKIATPPEKPIQSSVPMLNMNGKPSTDSTQAGVNAPQSMSPPMPPSSIPKPPSTPTATDRPPSNPAS